MTRNWLAGIVVLPWFVAPSIAQVPDPYQRKIEALAHPRFAEREKAARDLLAAGEPALKALRVAATSTDPEVRSRAAAIAERIERALRSDRLLVAPKLALKLDQVPLQQAVSEVAAKSGLRLQLEPAKDTNLQRPITLATAELPFWEAIEAFYAAAGLVENDNLHLGAVGESDINLHKRIISSRLSPLGGVVAPIRLTDAKSVAAMSSSTPADTSKAIRVRALPATFGQNKYDARTGEITLHLDVDPAPALAMHELIGVEVRRAIADDRQALAPAYPAGANATAMHGIEQLAIARQVVIVNGELVSEDGMGSGGSFFPVTLKASGHRPRQLATLEGVVVARVIAPPEALASVADVFGKGKGQEATTDVLSLTVQSVEDGGEAGPSWIRLRVVSRPDLINEVLNFPVQM
jgi:hypothetical protein